MRTIFRIIVAYFLKKTFKVIPKKIQCKKISCFWYRSFHKTRRKRSPIIWARETRKGWRRGVLRLAEQKKVTCFKKRMQYSGPDNAWEKETIVGKRKASWLHFFQTLHLQCNKNLVTSFPFIISYFFVFQAFYFEVLILRGAVETFNLLKRCSILNQKYFVKIQV